MTFDDLVNDPFALFFFLFSVLIYALFLALIIKNVKKNHSFCVGGVFILISHFLPLVYLIINEDLWLSPNIVPMFFTTFGVLAIITVTFFVLFSFIRVLIEKIP